MLRAYEAGRILAAPSDCLVSAGLADSLLSVAGDDSTHLQAPVQPRLG